MYPKNHKILKTATLWSNFTGSYKKKSVNYFNKFQKYSNLEGIFLKNVSLVSIIF